MIAVIVRITVRPDSTDRFVRETLENVAQSRREPGIAAFDLLRDLSDPCSFLLVEAYRDEDAPARHKETPHYARWRDAVEGMMAAPRSSTKYELVEPAP